MDLLIVGVIHVAKKHFEQREEGQLEREKLALGQAKSKVKGEGDDEDEEKKKGEKGDYDSVGNGRENWERVRASTEAAKREAGSGSLAWRTGPMRGMSCRYFNI